MFRIRTTPSRHKRNIWLSTQAGLGVLLTLMPARVRAQDVPAAGVAPAAPAVPAAAPAPAAAAPAAPAAMPTSAITGAEPIASPAISNEHKGKEVEGHIGVAFPLIMMDHPTKNIGDQVNIAVPIGIGFKTSEKLVFDFETVVATHVKQGGKATNLTVDPGIVYDLGPFAAGIRVKWDIGAPPNIGLIPLIHRGLVDLGGATWFIEAAFPTTYVTKNVNFDVVLHTGLGF
jgi:hypothetical protein